MRMAGSAPNRSFARRQDAPEVDARRSIPRRASGGRGAIACDRWALDRRIARSALPRAPIAPAPPAPPRAPSGAVSRLSRHSSSSSSPALLRLSDVRVRAAAQPARSLVGSSLRSTCGAIDAPVRLRPAPSAARRRQSLVRSAANASVDRLGGALPSARAAAAARSALAAASALRVRRSSRPSEHLDVGLPAAGAQLEDLALAPAVGTGNHVDLVQRPLAPSRPARATRTRRCRTRSATRVAHAGQVRSSCTSSA